MKKWVLAASIIVFGALVIGFIAKPVISKWVYYNSESNNARSTLTDSGNIEQIIDGSLAFMDVPFLTRNSDLIVIGTIVKKAKESTFVLQNLPIKTDIIYTDWQMAVKERLKGGSASVINIRITGGTANGKTTLISGEARLAQGELVLLFLRRHWWQEVLLPDNTYSIVGALQGKYSIDGEQAINKDSTRTQSLSALTGDIKHYLATGEPGIGPTPTEDFKTTTDTR